MKRVRSVALASTLFVILCPAAAAQDSEDTVPIDRAGTMKLALAKKAKQALARADASARGKRFRIRAGETDPSDARPTNIDFFGKLVFRSDEGRIAFRKLTLLRGPQNRLTGQTGGDTVTIARIRGGRIVRQGYDSTDIRRVLARLTKPAARAINRALEDRVFRSGMPLGRLFVDTRLSLDLIAPTGTTQLEFDPAAVMDFQAAGVAPAAIAPATLGDADADGLPEANLPINGGYAKTDASEALIRHAGGLSLSKPSTGLELQMLNPAVHLKMPMPILTVRIGQGLTPVADLDVSGMTKTQRADGADFAGVVARLNSSTAGFLNSSFQTDVFAAGDRIGTGRSSVTLK